MYHDAAQTIVETTDLANKLMGALRPGHFRGVATVVTKRSTYFSQIAPISVKKIFSNLLSFAPWFEI